MGNTKPKSTTGLPSNGTSVEEARCKAADDEAAAKPTAQKLTRKATRKTAIDAAARANKVAKLKILGLVTLTALVLVALALSTHTPDGILALQARRLLQVGFANSMHFVGVAMSFAIPNLIMLAYAVLAISLTIPLALAVIGRHYAMGATKFAPTKPTCALVVLFFIATVSATDTPSEKTLRAGPALLQITEGYDAGFISDPIDLSTGQPTAASSSSTDAWKAVDGDTGRAHPNEFHSSGGTNEWLRVQLKSATTNPEIVVYARDCCTSDYGKELFFMIGATDDKSQATECGSKSGIEASSTHTVTCIGTGRYVWIRGNPASSYYLEIPEIKVMGIPAPAVNHVGVEEVSWWNPSLWQSLESATPLVACNPAMCTNPAVCLIPNCTLVSFHDWYWVNNNYKSASICDTVAKQNGIGPTDCVPESYRVAWPTSASNENEACITAFGSDASNEYNDGIVATWFLMPATRMAFCYSQGYTSTYTSVSPDLAPIGHAQGYTGANWIYVNGVYNIDSAAGWKVSTRGYYAWPFTSFKLQDGTSTKNIGVHIFKRALCKLNASTGAYKCYNLKKSKCFQTDADFATTKYPSWVGSSQMDTFRSDTTKSPCSKDLIAKTAKHIATFIAAQ